MTGAEHYYEAEKLLTQAKSLAGLECMAAVMGAQVHATIALAAATAFSAAGIPQDGPTAQQWRSTITMTGHNR